jgi:hypothetical protein
MRKLLIGVILLLLVALPFAAQAGPSQKMCAGLEVRVYGKPITVVPEKCVPCTWNWCGAVLNRCPALVCGSPASVSTDPAGLARH